MIGEYLGEYQRFYLREYLGEYQVAFLTVVLLGPAGAAV